jgi:hypothetical protein
MSDLGLLISSLCHHSGLRVHKVSVGKGRLGTSFSEEALDYWRINLAREWMAADKVGRSAMLAASKSIRVQPQSDEDIAGFGRQTIGAIMPQATSPP